MDEQDGEDGNLIILFILYKHAILLGRIMRGDCKMGIGG
jgi:hypothetical protein